MLRIFNFNFNPVTTKVYKKLGNTISFSTTYNIKLKQFNFKKGNGLYFYPKICVLLTCE